jgi:hypothetical protein
MPVMLERHAETGFTGKEEQDRDQLAEAELRLIVMYINTLTASLGNNIRRCNDYGRLVWIRYRQT